MIQSRHTDRTSSGFTLIEMVATMGVMMLLIAIAVPAFLRWLPTFNLSAAARQVATDLQQARAKAVAQNCQGLVCGMTYQLNFSAATYVIQKCTPAPTSCTNDGGNIGLPTGISFSASGVVQFISPGILPPGTPAPASVVLSNGSAQKLVCVTLIGRVKIQNTSCT